MKNDVIRQGDLLFVPVLELPKHSERREGVVIQEGEATGHHHRLAVLDNAAIFIKKTSWQQFDTYVQVGHKPVEVTHEEHHTVILPANTAFKVNRAREYDYLSDAARYLAD